jgi:hypothetical protein
LALTDEIMVAALIAASRCQPRATNADSSPMSPARQGKLRPSRASLIAAFSAFSLLGSI